MNNTLALNPFVANTKNYTPWITIEKKKDGSSGSGNIISNNLAYDIANSDGSTLSNNIETGTNIDLHFVNPSNLDFHLKSTSNAINGGTDSGTPISDLEKYRRESPNDIGCYEYNSPGLNSPVIIEPINNQVVKIDSSITITVLSSDADDDKITISSRNLPKFAKLTDNSDGTASILVSPNETQKGEYSNIQIIAHDGIEYSKTSFILVVKENITSSATLQSDNNFVIYPNPISEKIINIQFSGTNNKATTLKLFSANGQLILSNNINKSNNKHIIQLPNNIKQVLYFVSIINDTQTITKKLLIN